MSEPTPATDTDAVEEASRSRRVISQLEDDIPSGWPRPYYVWSDGDTIPEGEYDPPRNTPRYVQWISAVASAQVMHCHSDRTYTAGIRFACSCCGYVMTRGLLLDVLQVRQHHSDPTHPNGVHDGHFGSPLCYRCATFALSQCPKFGQHDRDFGDGLRWWVVSDPSHYREVDDTSVVVLCADVPSTTTAEVRAELRAGNLYLTDVLVDTLPPVIRPDDYEDDPQGLYDGAGDRDYDQQVWSPQIVS